MKADSIKFKGYRCFKQDWAGFDTIKPINVIIGRNNTGKSHLLQLVEIICSNNYNQPDLKYLYRGIFDESSLKSVFRENCHMDPLPDDLWRDNGRPFVGHSVEWESDQQADININESDNIKLLLGDGRLYPMRHQCIRQILQRISTKISNTMFCLLSADRDVRPETDSDQIELKPDGSGATNIFRHYSTVSDPAVDWNAIKNNLLDKLNEIFAHDGHFTDLRIKLHKTGEPGLPLGHWEVYLREDNKGEIPLSRSGSGLKTVLLVLLNLLISL